MVFVANDFSSKICRLIFARRAWSGAASAAGAKLGLGTKRENALSFETISCLNGLLFKIRVAFSRFARYDVFVAGDFLSKVCRLIFACRAASVAGVAQRAREARRGGRGILYIRGGVHPFSSVS